MFRRNVLALTILCALSLLVLLQPALPGFSGSVFAANAPTASQSGLVTVTAKQACSTTQLDSLRAAMDRARGGWLTQLAPDAYQKFSAAREKYFNYVTRCATKLNLDLKDALKNVTAYDAPAKAGGSKAGGYVPRNPNAPAYVPPVASTLPYGSGASNPKAEFAVGTQFDGSPGTAAPPAKLGGLAMTAFPADPRANSTTVPGVNSPFGGALRFSPSATKLNVGSGSWGSWSHGYTGDVYLILATGGTMYMPPNTRAFYFYAQSNDLASFDFTATADDGTSSYPVSITSPGGAKYFGFYAPPNGTSLSSITVSCPGCGGDGFAVGEFGINVNTTADLQVSKFSEPHDNILAGQVFTYTIFVDNFGPNIAENVTVTDTLLSSSNISIQSCAFSVSQGGGAITQFTCTTGDLVSTQFGTDVGTFATNLLEPLSPGSQGRLRASFRLVSKIDIDVTNTTRATSDTFDPNMNNNFATDTLSVTGVADIQGFAVFGAEVQTNGLPGKKFDSNVVTAMPDPACCNFGGTTTTAGRRIQWDSTALNAGPSIARNTKIEVALPFGTSLIENTLTGLPSPFTSAQGRCLAQPDGAIRTRVVCDYGNLDPGAQARVQFLVLVDPALPVGTQLSFDAFASSETYDTNDSNNIASIQFDSNAFGDLAISKTANGAAITDGTFFYEYDISNKGPSWSRDVTLSDALPPEVDFVNAFIDPEGDGDANPLQCTVQAGTLLCPLGDIKPTGTQPIKVYANVHVKPDTLDGANISDTVTLLMDTPDPFLSDNSDSLIVAVSSQDLVLTKTAPASAGAGEEITYNLTVDNTGPLQANNVQVTDYIPAGLKLLTLTPDQGSCIAGVEGDPLRPFVCSLGNMPSNTTLDIVVTGKVLAGTLGDSLLVNDAQVSGEVPEASQANNIDTVTTLVNATCTTKPVNPTQISPVPAALIKQRTVLLDWTDTNCASFYRVSVRQGAQNGPVVVNARRLKVSQYTTPALERGFDYYWRARACNGIGCVNTPWQVFHVKP